MKENKLTFNIYTDLDFSEVYYKYNDKNFNHPYSFFAISKEDEQKYFEQNIGVVLNNGSSGMSLEVKVTFGKVWENRSFLMSSRKFTQKVTIESEYALDAIEAYRLLNVWVQREGGSSKVDIFGGKITFTGL